jgi:hypothetical protein
VSEKSIRLRMLLTLTRRPGVMDSHSHAKNIFGLNDLMGMWGVVFAAKRPNSTMTKMAFTA